MDDVYMRRALELAERGRGLVSPNPLVGAVVVRDGEIVGEGWHEGPGRPHAEIVALDAAGDSARGADLYVSLEPCSHFGRTPPCAPRVAASGVARVMAALEDPNPLVNGEGFAHLRQAGVHIQVGALADVARQQNEAFLKHVRTRLPFVTLKMAASLDGKAAARDGSSRWITGEEARAEVHRMRSAADAILVGAGTALRDDPSLTVRDPDYRGRPKLRVIVDGRGIVPETHRIFSDGLAPSLVATSEGAPRERRDAWRRTGAEVLVLDDAGSALIPLEDLLAELGKRDVQHVLMEGGPTIAWEAVQRNLVDKVVLFFAPVLVGGETAPSVLMGGGTATIGDAVPLELFEVTRVGRDFKVVAYVHRDR
ncbi:MAG TPA: bifunctional diaminohydroxyphosphoribosylaminopyrimidine deaminase/5-amino-6-(5-phosphoribosylamino)uracil reductase RibD [Actinomycetota bacterium]|nr:bifunctional diaminohydroxyphosphoribosylaminopyrimidine deaminase/5-amino-6-(5-phosphoribosylamino)uracil reductase RibD [Actinomycetota bacterium]